MVREIHSVVVGIIPAYAGSTSALDNRVEYLQDHPRVRGEHQTFTAPYTMGIGSSPRTRGARRRCLAGRVKRGIIPAYAGSTTLIPRLRISVLGSSPRTRGARGVRTVGARRYGIIPAYAGSTPKATVQITCPWDHPRVRGEHAGRTISHDESAGSSPRTRGARIPVVRYRVRLGIIPAYAGST